MSKKDKGYTTVEAEKKPTTPVGRIGKEEIALAAEELRKYKEGKKMLDSRIISNEKWFKLRHWEEMRTQETDGDEPSSAWLFNSILNKHADAMDNYPEPSVLPREEGDEEDADILSEILPVILEQNNYEQVYSDTWYKKLNSGTGAKGVFWDSSKLNGFGDIDVRNVDILNLYWQPGVTDIQKSKNLFYTDIVDNDTLLQMYPEQLKNVAFGSSMDKPQYVHDESIDTSNKTEVVDWYYKVREGNRDILHYCKFVNDIILFSSENSNEYANGWYEHGKYPFVLDVMFPVADSPAGFGYIDIMKSPQAQIDTLNQCILKNAKMSASIRWLVKTGGSINETEFADWTKPFVHVNSLTLDDGSIKQIETPKLDGNVTNLMQLKIEELKETSGNRDFSQGGTSSGVTAASAIAALQEAGSKLSRDANKSAYRAFQQECYLIIELIRQFYDEERSFRIIGNDGKPTFETYSNAKIKEIENGNDFDVDLGVRKPIFDIRVQAQRSSPFSKIAQNEMAKEFYSAGFFDPMRADQALACIEMMEFEGKDGVVDKISQGQTMLNMIQQLQQQMQQLNAIIDMQNGTNLSEAMAQEQGMAMPDDAMTVNHSSSVIETNQLGQASRVSNRSNVSQARERAAQSSTPT